MPPLSKHSIAQDQLNGETTPDLIADYRQKQRGDSVDVGHHSFPPGTAFKLAKLTDAAKVVAGARWLLKSWLPYGMLSATIAEPKAGKSAFALGAFVKPIITGCRWFNGAPRDEPGYVVGADIEGSNGTNVERARAWGPPLDKIIGPFDINPLQPINLEDNTHMERLFNVIRTYKARLVVIDGFRGAHKGDENNSRIASVLQRLVTITERTKTAMHAIHHTKKLGEGEELIANSSRGSNAFLAMVRYQIAIDQTDSKNDWRHVRMLGENFGVSPDPIGFRISEKGLEFGPAPTWSVKKPTDKSKEMARNWLQILMKPEISYPAEGILAEATAIGFLHTGSLAEVTASLGVVIVEFNGVYHWQRPESPLRNNQNSVATNQ